MLVQQISQFTNMAHQWLWGSGKRITSSPGLGARLMGASAPTPSPQSCGHIQAKAAPLQGHPPLTGRAGVRKPAHPCKAWDEAWDTCGPGRTTGGRHCLFFFLLPPSFPSFHLSHHKCSTSIYTLPAFPGSHPLEFSGTLHLVLCQHLSRPG